MRKEYSVIVQDEILNKDELMGIYRKRARRYDFTANHYYLMGFRE